MAWPASLSGWLCAPSPRRCWCPGGGGHISPALQVAGVGPAAVSPYHVGCEDENPLVLATGPLWVVQQVGVVLQGIPHVTPCKQMAALRHHKPRALVSGFGQLKPQQNLPVPREQWELRAP